MLRLSSLTIRAIGWGTDKGKFRGEIEYVGEKGRVAVTISHSDWERLLPVVADAIVASSREVAESLTKEAMASLPPEQLKIA
jgi:hypothetical protein